MMAARDDEGAADQNGGHRLQVEAVPVDELRATMKNSVA